jgi:hypothetical protein
MLFGEAQMGYLRMETAAFGFEGRESIIIGFAKYAFPDGTSCIRVFQRGKVAEYKERNLCTGEGNVNAPIIIYPPIWSRAGERQENNVIFPSLVHIN